MKKKNENEQPKEAAKQDNTILLTAKTLDELAEQVNNLDAETKYMAGAVGRHRETGEFTLRLDKIE